MGEIWEFHSAQAGKRKYHICVQSPTDAQAGYFLFINSKTGYDGDLTLVDGEISCLPASPTGQTVVSCSLLVRANHRQLQLFCAEKIGDLSIPVARKLHKFVQTAQTFTKTEQQLVLDALANLI